MDRKTLTPRTISVGNGSLLITDETFLNGYQAGHLSYMADGRAVQFSDSSLTALIMDKLESMDHPEAYCVGYVVGWISTFASKEPKRPEGAPA
jgi:hypothetical protein